MKSKLVIAITFVLIAVVFIVMKMMSPNQTPQIQEEKLLTDIKKQIKQLKWDSDPEEVIELLNPSVGIKVLDTMEFAPLGHSKFGGKPDLPFEKRWPTFSGIPMSFIAQINLSEVSVLGREYDVPKHGWLYFFMYINDEDYHFPEETGEYRILYHAGDVTGLEQKEFPEDLTELGRFKEKGIGFFNHYSLPSYLNKNISDLHLSDGDVQRLKQVSTGICALTGAEQEVHHQFLGEATSLMGDVNYMWADNYIIFENYSNTVKFDINEVEKDFMLLLEVDFFDDKLGFEEFGGKSSAYFGIRNQDLNDKKFQKSVLIFQSE